MTEFQKLNEVNLKLFVKILCAICDITNCYEQNKILLEAIQFLDLKQFNRLLNSCSGDEMQLVLYWDDDDYISEACIFVNGNAHYIK